MRSQVRKHFLRIFIINTFLLATIIGCKKDVIKDENNFDIKNEIFRVMTNSDVRYDVHIFEIYPEKLIGDTILNINVSGTSDINYGFTPRKGSRLVVSVSGKDAKILNCTVAYKGKRLGSDNLKVQGNLLYIDFQYEVQ